MYQHTESTEEGSDSQGQDSDSIKRLNDMPEGSQVEFSGGLLVKPHTHKPHEHYYIPDGFEGKYKCVKCKFCPQGKILTEEYKLEDGKIIHL